MSKVIVEERYENDVKLREKIGHYFSEHGERWTEAWTFVKEAITGEPLDRDSCGWPKVRSTVHLS